MLHFFSIISITTILFFKNILNPQSKNEKKNIRDEFQTISCTESKYIFVEYAKHWMWWD